MKAARWVSGVERGGQKTLGEDHPIPGWTGHVTYISGFFYVPMVSDRFCPLQIGFGLWDPFQLAFFTMASKWGAHPKHVRGPVLGPDPPS